MNNLLRELEALKISNNFSENGLWIACIDLIEKSYVPEKTIGFTRPYEEEDFKDYREIIDENLRNIQSTLQHIVRSRKYENVQINLNAQTVRTFAIKLLLLIGEQDEKNIWNTTESVSITGRLICGFLELYRYKSICKFLMDEDNFKTVLLMLRPKLLKDTWKAYPAAVTCYKWIFGQVEKPVLYTHIESVLPTTLLLIDDYSSENVVIGLECLYQILQHSHLRKGIIDNGYAEVILNALERIIREKKSSYVVLAYLCITSLLATVEHWDTTVYDWSIRDNVLSVLLDNMELEQNVEFRRVYMLSLPQLLTNIGCAKWCVRLTRILCEYCDHHTDLQTLKATLETAKTFLLMFHHRVASHCVPLYTSFLKLHYDFSKIPIFDKQIIQNLEDCILLLYKLSPNTGCAVMNDDRMHTVIKNSLQIINNLNDTKYFQ